MTFSVSKWCICFIKTYRVAFSKKKKLSERGLHSSYFWNNNAYIIWSIYSSSIITKQGRILCNLYKVIVFTNFRKWCFLHGKLCSVWWGKRKGWGLPSGVVCFHKVNFRWTSTLLRDLLLHCREGENMCPSCPIGLCWYVCVDKDVLLMNGFDPQEDGSQLQVHAFCCLWCQLLRIVEMRFNP